MNWSLLWLALSLLCSGVDVGAADSVHGFVGLADNGSLVLQPPPGQQVLVDGVVFRSLVERLFTLEQQQPLVQLPSKGQKWFGGVLANNGKIYGIPLSSPSVLIIDPATDTADTTAITGLGSGEWKWVGGVLATNGKIYGIPGQSRSVLIINPATNTTDTTTIVGLGDGGFKWKGGVLANNGKIYGIPASVLIVDPTVDTADTASITGLPSGAQKWRGGVLAPNGKIYGIPDSSASVLILQCRVRLMKGL